MKIAIDIPENVYTRLFDNGIQDNEIETDDICEMARALRLGKPLDEQDLCNTDTCKVVKAYMNEWDKPNNSDAISRQAALNVADYTDYTGLAVEDVKKVTDAVVKELKCLPPVTPEQKTGHWILGICDCCGYDWGKDAPIASVPKFCPNCGRRMVEPQESEVEE